MISCLNNLIGLRGIAGFEHPDSGLFINDLEGVTTQRIEDIGDNEDHYEPRLAFDDIYNRSARLFEHDIKTGLKRFYKDHSETVNDITSQLDESVDLAQGTAYNGWLFDLGWRSQNRRLRFNTVTLYLNTAVDFSIYIFDATTGEQLEKIGFEGTQGLNTYRILKSYPVWKYQNLFIAYDDSEVSTKRTERSSIHLGNVLPGTISKANTVLRDIISGADTGMILNYSWECSVDNFVCQRLDMFTVPFQYKLGIEFCKELLHSDRINRFTLMDRETAQELKESFTEEYKQMIENIFIDIKVDDGDCFECAKELTVKQSLP